MTYEESYLGCKTPKELNREIKHDIEVAMLLGNNDRIKVISRVANKVANERNLDISDLGINENEDEK